MTFPRQSHSPALVIYLFITSLQNAVQILSKFEELILLQLIGCSLH